MADRRVTQSQSDPALDAPVHGLWWAAAVCAVATLIMGYPALGGSWLVSPPSDQYIGGYLVCNFGTHWWKALGHLPQWNMYLFGGVPYLAPPNGDVFYPMAVLRWFLP